MQAVTAHDVESFCNLCVSLRSLFRHFQILFEEGADLRRELLQSIAPTFFGDISHLLIEHLILQICKITDREESFGRKNSRFASCSTTRIFPQLPASLIS
jgi:hypothetical protein